MIEGLLTGLLQKYGVTPQHVQMTLRTIEAINRAVTELDGFKTASGQVVAHFNKRLDALDTRLADVEACLQVAALKPALSSPVTTKDDPDV
jgi:hypothetical protein